MKKQVTTILMLFLLGATTFIGCDKEDQVTVINNLPSQINTFTLEQRLTEQGWMAFAQGNFQQAVDSFLLSKQTNSLYMDAYIGLGWAYARLDSLNTSMEYFTMSMVSDQDMQIYKDACAGRCFVNLALSDYERAIEDVDATILKIVQGEYYDSYSYVDYVFRHVATISQYDLLLVKAESYFMLGEYELCYYALWWIDNTLEETFNPEELAMIIEELRNSI